MTKFRKHVLRAVSQHEFTGTIEPTMEIYGDDFTPMQIHNVSTALNWLKLNDYVDDNGALTIKGTRHLAGQPVVT